MANNTLESLILNNLPLQELLNVVKHRSHMQKVINRHEFPEKSLNSLVDRELLTKFEVVDCPYTYLRYSDGYDITYRFIKGNIPIGPFTITNNIMVEVSTGCLVLEKDRIVMDGFYTRSISNEVLISPIYILTYFDKGIWNTNIKAYINHSDGTVNINIKTEKGTVNITKENFFIQKEEVFEFLKNLYSKRKEDGLL